MSLARRAKQVQRRELEELSAGSNKVIETLKKIQKVLPHPLWGIVVATLITFSGRGELQLRSCGLLLIALWLAVDLWAWLLPKRRPFKFIYGATICDVMLIGIMGIMWWWLDGKLEQNRAEVFDHISISHFIPSGEEDDPMNTVFTATNNSSQQVSKKHGITCFTRLAVGNDGEKYFMNKESVSRGGQSLMLGSDLTFGHQPAEASLGPGGDAESARCLRYFGFAHGFTHTECVDVKIQFWYSLEDQIDIDQEKLVRLVATKDKGNSFFWQQQPISSEESYCAKFIKRR
jgi:hypothetical protein